MNYKPQFLKQDEKTTFAVLPYDEYVSLMEELEDLRDSLLIKQAQAENGDKPRLSFEEIKQKHQFTP